MRECLSSDLINNILVCHEIDHRYFNGLSFEKEIRFYMNGFAEEDGNKLE